MTAADVPPRPPDPLVTRLRADAAASVGGGLVLILGGVAASLGVVLVLVLLLAIVTGLPGLSFTAWYVVLAGAYAGLAFAWLAKRADFFADSTFEYVDPRQEWLGVGRFRDGVAGAAAVMADGVFIGPRMMRSGIQQTEGREPPSRERFFDRCALLLRQMANAGEAVTAAQVRVGDDETAAKLSPVIDYLDRTGWIGHSSDGTRLWLSSKAKTDLPRIGAAAGFADA